ncbi:hypothetical protein [Bradyrhizobium japonicum]|uniref:hypothetical protein n=1 Tax=Bradyrhizobium japonicum TaxID=375 RepID=UPI00271510CC|nr:hypothetical protein [Bradyrhizobium japonicum]WLB24208.1 hypothetical protein QIH95_47410 [Bradyrhizobium japonicum]
MTSDISVCSPARRARLPITAPPANHASSFDHLRLAISMLGAGGSAASTAIGQRCSLDNAVATTGMNNATTLEAQRIASDRARETQLAIDQRTLTPVLNDNGVTHYVPKSQAAGGEAPMTNVVANMLRRQAVAAQPGQTSSDPLGNVDPRILKKAGLDLPEQTLIEPRTGQTAISRDGGRTAILPDGRTVFATGFQPVSTDAALVQARDNNVRSSASTPLVVGGPNEKPRRPRTQQQPPASDRRSQRSSTKILAPYPLQRAC